MSSSGIDILISRLKAYKKKYYKNVLIKGGIFFFTFISFAYLFVSVLEFYGRFPSYIRSILFFLFIGITLFSLYRWILRPVFHLLSLNKSLTDEEAAEQIGRFFPNVKDKLLNTLQLSRLSATENDFIAASISQKTKELSLVDFGQAVNLKGNTRYLRYLVIPFILIIGVSLFIPQLFSESTARIINYNKEFTYPAPFHFILKNKDLNGYRNEDFNVNLALTGKAVPDNVYLVSNGKRSKMKKERNGEYSYLFRSLQHPESFHFEAAGYTSEEFSIEMLKRPDLKFFDVSLNYPAYLGKPGETFNNAGNLTVPEGTNVTWSFSTVDADNILINFSEEDTITLESRNNSFEYARRLKDSKNYSINVSNEYGTGKEKISYRIDVIPDKYPSLNVEQYKDTALYKNIGFGGSVSDDYGLTSLKLFYRKHEKGTDKKFTALPISLPNNNPNQSFIYNLSLDSMDLKSDETLEYYLAVWDNDGVNGFKMSKTPVYKFTLPDQRKIKEQISSSAKSTSSKMDKMIKESRKIQKELKEHTDKLKTKKDYNWQDKKQLEDLLKKQENLEKEVEELQQQHKKLNEQEAAFKSPDQETMQKMQQLQKLMDELLDEETKEMYKKLQEMMEKQVDKEKLREMLEKMQEQNENMEQDLNRTLELFKEMEFEKKLQESISELEKLSEDQKKLSEKTEKKEGEKEELLEEQQEMNEKFEDIKKDMDELDEMNKQMKNQRQMENTGEKESEIQEKQQESLQNLEQNKNKKAGESQKDASEKMQEMAQQMMKMQQEMQQEQLQENMDNLRDILENLVKLSFDQEDLMKEFKKVNQSDPRYLDLSQKQMKIKDDSRIIEDSLMALAERVFQIQSFVTKELRKMNKHIDESVEELKDRNPAAASGKQQFAMTSMNNLALMLDDVLQQMQQQMANMKGGGQSMCQKPKSPGSGSPSLSEMQKQLGERMKQMMKGGKSGEKLSEELARMAAQQEMIRKAMKEMEQQGKNGKQAKKLKELMEEMEKNEEDLVNKNLTRELIERQQEIQTRLLEAEKAMRERDLDEKRESERGKQKEREMPPSLEEYLKEKQRQIELLKTVDPSLTPYFKKEVNEYFEKIEK